MRTLARRYEIGARLGGGAMADVYRAYDRILARPVALKVMRPALAVDVELARRFDREADVIAAIDHPGVVRVTDHGAADDEHYIAMELVEGPTLQQLLQERGRLPEDEARRIAEDIAAGLAAAHAAGIVHRDLKPANVLLAGDGHAKVSDFGIAHLEAMTQLTRTGEVFGTPRYIAPEQLSATVDARADVYALGVVLYEMVVGHPPFDGGSSIEIVAKHLRDRPVPPHKIVPGLSRRLERVILRALEKDPARRFASAADMRDALRPPQAAPVPAYASRAAPFQRGHLAGAAFAAVVLLVTLAGVAVARVGEAWPLARPVAAGESPASPVPTTAPQTSDVARTTTTPEPATPSPTPEPATPSPAPSPTSPAVTAPPLIPARTSAPAADEAAAAIGRFYQLITAERFDEAAALWTARMRAQYPPATNIYGRFSSTKSISLVAWSVASRDPTGAAINVNVLEVMDDGSSRRWVGQWHVVLSGTTWLMDQPALVRA